MFGTLHGPGYSGGQSYGGTYDLSQPVADAFHTFAVEWQPNKIVWFIDGIQYFQATPNDAFLQGKQWVFNHPFFMLLNVAVGGNFGGAVGGGTTFPQTHARGLCAAVPGPARPVGFAAVVPRQLRGLAAVDVPFTAFRGPARQCARS